MEVKYPEINVKLVGSDGIAYVMLGRFTAPMTSAGCTPAQVKAFLDDATSRGYDNVLQTCMRYVSVE